MASTVKDKTSERRQHSKSVQIRLKPDQHKKFKEAADHCGLSLSGWIRERLLACAAQEPSQRGLSPPPEPTGDPSSVLIVPGQPP